MPASLELIVHIYLSDTEFHDEGKRGEPIACNIAETLREVIIGDGAQPGILYKLTRYLDPA